MSNQATKKLTLISLVLMIFTSVYGFANMTRGFYLMGYAAIPWYILGAVTFFLPYAFMMAEYGAAFRSERGGIFSWMTRSVGPKYAFIGTFMWFASYIVWQVNIASSIWVPLSNALFGEDRTSTLTLFGFNSTQLLGILGVLWIISVTFISSKGITWISKVSSIGGLAVSSLNVILILGGIITLLFNHGHFAQPIHPLGNTLFTSPNPAFASSISIVSFFTYAIFAYGGIEAVGGLVDQTHKAEVTFPKGVAISAVIISIGYSLGIFIIGTFINWQNVLSAPNVNTANVTYIIMRQLGYECSRAIGLNQSLSLTIGHLLARLSGLGMFLTFTGAFFTLIYSPLKQLIEGTPKLLWPSKLTKLNANMPVNAMWVQACMVIILIIAVSFGGENASVFFNKLVVMTNVAMTIPYMFLSAGFWFFKKKKNIHKPFVIYKNEMTALIASFVVTFVIGFANIFSILEPWLVKNNKSDTFFAGIGPLVFAIIAYALYTHYEKKQFKNQ